MQLIAGSTYSVSLPKEWIKKNRLKAGNEILIMEGSDKNITISAHENKVNFLEHITIDTAPYLQNIGQVLYAVYYLGVDKITLCSKNDLTENAKQEIRETLRHMSGTEIIYEDKKRIEISVLLDKSKVTFNHLLSRTALLINDSINNIIERKKISGVKLKEDEIDRLYHLMVKLISVSLIDSKTIKSSGIENVSLIPSLFLISKRLENIGDCIVGLAVALKKSSADRKNSFEVLNLTRNELERSIKHLTKKASSGFSKISPEQIEKTKAEIAKIKDKNTQTLLHTVIRYLGDIEEEVINISFYNNLFNEKEI